MKRAFTLIELTISIALLGTIIGSVFAIYATATKSYRVQSQKSYLQRELNFVGDALANELKLGHNVLADAAGQTLSSNTLILQVPAIDENGNFINMGVPEYDIYIYKKEGSFLRKIVIPSANSTRSPKDQTVLTDVANVNFTYSPDMINPLSISALIEINRPVGKNNINLKTERSAFLRNK